jgi:hypothetical protein
MNTQRTAGLATCLLLLAPLSARAADLYKIQPIFTAGEKVGAVQTDPDGDIEMNSLNDRGDIAVVTESSPKGETLLLYSGGKPTPLVIPKADAPGGKWADGPGVRGSVLNQQGNVFLVADVTINSKTSLGAFFWDAAAAKLSAVNLTGMPAPNGLTFTNGAGDFAGSINNHDEIAFTASVPNAAGQSRPGVFLRGADGKLQAVLTPDQALPDGGKARFGFASSINDAGVVAFFTRREGEKGSSAYAWEKGTITPVATVGTDMPGGGKLADVWRVWLNNKNRNVLIAARTDDAKGPTRLYALVDGKLKQMLAPGQALPDGGKLQRLQADIPGVFAVGSETFGLTAGVSQPNESGQHAFLARLEDGSTAAFVMDPDGTLTPVMRGGRTTDLGKIDSIGESGVTGGGGVDSFGIGLNSKGQVAFVVNIAARGPTLVLLTPVGQQ